MEERAYYFFQICFKKCKEQFEEVGLLLVDMEDFFNFDKAISFLPKETAATESAPYDKELEDLNIIEYAAKFFLAIESFLVISPLFLLMQKLYFQAFCLAFNAYFYKVDWTT